jgi:hypothetical protein
MSHYVITATITDRWGGVESIYAGSQPAWAWDIDRCAAWRKVMRASLLADRTSDPRGWRVDFTAEPEEMAS